jgi:hypothetical protein
MFPRVRGAHLDEARRERSVFVRQSYTPDRRGGQAVFGFREVRGW